jgi:opacity protein-like surface antigen
MKRYVLFLVIALCATAPPGAMAQSDMGLKSLGAAVGYVSPDNLDGTFGIGAFANWGMITPRIGLESRLDFWSWSESAFGAESKVRDVSLGARGKYFFNTANPRLQPFVGAGLALHFVKAEVSVEVPGFPPMSVSDSETKLGLDLGGGLSIPMSPRTAFLGELWYGIVPDVSQFSLRAGVSFAIGS